MEALSLKLLGGVPVEIVSTRGPGAVKVTCENTEVANPLLWLHRRQQVCSVFDQRATQVWQLHGL